MKKLLLIHRLLVGWAVLVCTILIIWFFGAEKGEKKTGVRWIGHPYVAHDDPFTPSAGWLPDYEIGFLPINKNEGYVVYRKIKDGAAE